MLPLRIILVALLLFYFRAADAETRKDEGEQLKYDPEQILSEIFGLNETTPRQAGYGLAPQPFFPEPAEPQSSQQDPLAVPQTPQKKRRRRRRKPKFQTGVSPGYGLLYPDALEGQPGSPALPDGYQPPLVPSNYGLYPQRYGTQPQRVPPPPRAGALEAVSSALDTIARHDDRQCVPRLLCEVASGRDSGATQTSLLPSFINMQPLLTLLAAYSGMSSSPLLVFGRAALLGMTSRERAAACRDAYPQCPSDPDQLLHYLNNHNGGFFRFFSGTPSARPVDQSVGQPVRRPVAQGLQQFYSHLAIPHQYDQSHYNANEAIPQTNYGLYQQDSDGQIGNNYGHNYGYGIKNEQFKNIATAQNGVDENRIQKRIQNSPTKYVSSPNKHEIKNNYLSFENNKADDSNSKWSFPERDNDIAVNNVRAGKTLKFPQNPPATHESTNPDESDGLAKGFAFPEGQSNRQYVDYYNYPPVINAEDHPLKTGTGDLKFDSSGQEAIHFEYSEPPGGEVVDYNSAGDDGEVIYVLRGDGDPNNPELLRLKPGQNIY